MTALAIIPWIEKYRPTKFADIVFDRPNKLFFNNMITQSYFPNMLFYGPPGTGKTTTILNLIAAYQKLGNTGSVIHLNASDDRGVDVIRTQIYQFAKSRNIFGNGLKFVILDEVDFMTKNAQQALKYLLSTCTNDIRFCLICNYITKIDETLRNEFICIRFNQLPADDVLRYLRCVADCEKVDVTDSDLQAIRNTYMSDLRAMINFLQQGDITNTKAKILCNDQLETLHAMFCASPRVPGDTQRTILHIHGTCAAFNIDVKSFMQRYFNYIIRDTPERITRPFMKIVGNVIHNNCIDVGSVLNYFCVFLHRHFSGAPGIKLIR